ncbi:MAG: hypothetical protein K2K04_00865 [Clostridia bacterium]|nr:hypothetical protein [Clostridia bacterium]
MEQDAKEITWEDVRGAEYISPAVLLKMVKAILAEEMGAVYRFERDGLKISFVNGQKFRLKIEEIK